MKKINIIALMALGIAGIAASCSNFDDAQYVAADELGVLKDSYVLPAEPEQTPWTDTIIVYANKTGKAQLLDESDNNWIRLVNTSFEANDGFKPSLVKFMYTSNVGRKRMAKIVISTETRKDTVNVYQEGVASESFNFPVQAVSTLSSEREISVPVEIDVPIDEVSVFVEYSGGEKWITNDIKKTLSSTGFKLQTLANPSEDDSRRAYVFFSWRDGWNVLHRYGVTVTQTGSNDSFGTETSFNELRDMVMSGSVEIQGNYIINGYIVSDNENLNNGECAMEVMDNIDYASNDITVYMESLDGKYGLRIFCRDASNNVFKRYTKVKLAIDGTTLSVSGDAPERFTLSEVSSDMLLSSEEVGPGGIPVKEKYIEDLTDEDVYTYVTLKDCELPIRKGPLTPINEGYALLFSNKRVNKYPALVRDIKGGSLYMFTNITCPYRRDGRRLPNGSGTISGIIVHESYRQFVDQDNSVEDYCGNIGRYQIRHLSREEINLAEDFNDNFSGLITEYRYIKLDCEATPGTIPSSKATPILPTYGSNGNLTHTYADYNSMYNTRVTNFGSTFFYLGPVGKETKADGDVNGCGIILEDGTDYRGTPYRDPSYWWNPSSGVCKDNYDGKGWLDGGRLLSLANKYWWNAKEGKGYSWEIMFSTEGYVSDQVSCQIAMYNTGQSNSLANSSPRYWKIEYSIDNKASWKKVEDFTVPDVCGWANTMLSQSIASKPMNFKLPLEILGQKVVYIRLTPTKDKATEGGLTYDTGVIANNSGCNTMDYFAVRYNK